MNLAFQGVPHPVRLVDCEELLPVMRKVIASWPFSSAELDPMPDPIITIRGKGAGAYVIEAPWLDAPIAEVTAVSTVCSFILDLVRAWSDADPSMLCMHCGAAKLGGGLVVFPNTNRAGKSTLIARVAAEGMTIFADDLLPLTPDGDGFSLGMRPRLRLPLPRGAGADFLRFVQKNKGPSDRRYAYLNLPASLLAPFGERCPIGAFVLLERRVRRPAELTPASRGMGLQHLLQQNFIRPGGVLSTFDRLRGLAETKPCYRLVYSDLDEAVHLLTAAFAAKAPGNHAGKADRVYIRSPDVVAQIVDGEWFLISPDRSAIFCLNPTARAVWEMLAKPLSEEAAVSIMHEAFPHEDSRAIRRDIHGLFAELKRRGLIRPAADGLRIADGGKQWPPSCLRRESGSRQFIIRDA